MRVFSPRERPRPWHEQKEVTAHAWALPFIALEWWFEWAAYFLSNWKFLEVLEYISSLSILVAVIFYFSESGDRAKQRHYQAWQVVNTAQGKGGSGGRVEALQELNADHVPLVGVDVSGAFLQGIHLEKSSLLRANFSAADARCSDFRGSDLADANLQSTNLRGSRLFGVSLQRAQLEDADLFGADLSEADLSEASLANADLRNSNLRNVRWHGISSIEGANIHGVKNAPDGFVAWALQHGAVENESDPQ